MAEREEVGDRTIRVPEHLIETINHNRVGRRRHHFDLSSFC